MSGKTRPVLPLFTQRFTYLLGNVKWIERGRITTHDKTSLARMMTMSGFPVSPQYIGKLATGEQANPSAYFVMTAGNVFGDTIQFKIGARYFFESEWEERINHHLSRRNKELERYLATRMTANR